MIGAGMREAQIRRQYAQALIDQEALIAAETVLQTIIRDPQATLQEKNEARGLMGRIYKELFLSYADSATRRANLARAINAYYAVYHAKPKENLWHGINVVALTARARQDNLPIASLPDEKSIAAAILTVLRDKEAEATGPPQAWDVATTIEANVALNQFSDATDAALRYVQSFGADAFEIKSTLSQLTRVWQLTDKKEPGSQILPILHSALLSRQGESVKLKPREIQLESSEAAQVDRKIETLEHVFVNDQSATLSWYKKGLDQCNGIARIETLDGRALGTGFIVKASDFFPDRNDLLVLTVAYVIGDHDYAVPANEAQANFQTLGRVIKVDEIVWSSSYLDLDATFVSLKENPPDQPLVLSKKDLKMTEPPPHVYVIGHPSGRDLEVSLQDNNLLARNERLLHYRSATEPGSGGSPVFESTDWQVIGLHHAGGPDMQRIDGVPGTYAANEGISILAIQKATRAC